MAAIASEYARIHDSALLSSFITNDTVQSYMYGLIKYGCWNLVVGVKCSQLLTGTTPADLKLIKDKLEMGKLD